jgi:signal transduction histidine kinase
MRIPKLGLQARMTASYVLVTAAVVLIVEGFGFAILLPQIQSQSDLLTRVNTTAAVLADKIGVAAAGNGGTLTVGAELGATSTNLKPGQVASSGKALVIPQVVGKVSNNAAMTAALVISTKGEVLASSYPALFPLGSAGANQLPADWSGGGSAIGAVAGNQVAWATAPIFPTFNKGGKPGSGIDPNGAGPDKSKLLGFVYVQAPLQASSGLPPAAVQPLVQTGLVLLAATLPVGVLFGLLTTRGAVRRLRRLADGTMGFAAGDFSARVPASGVDEVSQLERHFNQMAERLESSIAEQRGLAERNARLAERSRISRELHDSISQDLFSLSTLAGGLKKAVPPGSKVQPQLETLSATVASMIQEMRALLLELRPTALDEKGLLPALEDLCDAYEERVGVRVVKDLEGVSLDPAAEHAVFRVAQEGLANAARHAEAGEIALRLHPSKGGAELVVTDNGRGFDRRDTGSRHGLGLKLMAERVQELGGSVAIKSRPGRGTELRVSVPGIRT